MLHAGWSTELATRSPVRSQRSSLLKWLEGHNFTKLHRLSVFTTRKNKHLKLAAPLKVVIIPSSVNSFSPPAPSLPFMLAQLLVQLHNKHDQGIHPTANNLFFLSPHSSFSARLVLGVCTNTYEHNRVDSTATETQGQVLFLFSSLSFPMLVELQADTRTYGFLARWQPIACLELAWTRQPNTKAGCF